MKSYKTLQKQRDDVADELLSSGILRASIRLQGNKCGGSKGCQCKRKENPILHGPYHYLSFRGAQGNHSIMLTKYKLEYAQKAVGNYKKIMQCIIELSDLDFQIVRYYHQRLKELSGKC